MSSSQLMIKGKHLFSIGKFMATREDVVVVVWRSLMLKRLISPDIVKMFISRIFYYSYTNSCFIYILDMPENPINSIIWMWVELGLKLKFEVTLNVLWNVTPSLIKLFLYFGVHWVRENSFLSIFITWLAGLALNVWLDEKKRLLQRTKNAGCVISTGNNHSDFLVDIGFLWII